ncbi:MAG: SUMF1/EgtB/PvdO family nonheme iron enzyme [Phycisphaerales bacterium]|nr:SUMF1/EgtB/PvdO family nonheme iron enzyme [Phycisphaerales bacterium]
MKRPTDLGEPPTGTLGADAPRYVITIASDAYAFEGFPPLDSAEQDADTVEHAFVERLGFETRADLRLRGDTATTDGILHLFGDEGALKGLPRNAMAVVYIALHGRTRDCAAPAMEGETPRPRRCGQLVTRDAQRGSQTIELIALLGLIARYGPHHTIVLVDTCYSGLALGVPVKELDYATVVRTLPDGASPTTATGPGERRSRKVLTSAGPTQGADDGDATRPTVFAEALLQGLDGAADLYADGWLLFPELAVYLHAEVVRLSGGKQEPEYDGFYDDGRGAPVLGALRLGHGDAAADPDVLFARARAQVERREIHGAIWSLKLALAARTGRARAERRALREAEALAAAGKGAQAIARLDALPRPNRGAGDAALAVRRQIQARIARQTRQPEAEVARLEARAAEAGVELAQHTASASGRARLLSGLGGVAMLVGASPVAGGLAAEARAAVEAGGEPGLVATLAGNEAVAFDAAGISERMAAARAVEKAAAAEAEAAQWPARDKLFIDDYPPLDATQRLVLVHAWVKWVGEGAPATIDLVERFGRLFAAVERARRQGAAPEAVTEAWGVVLDAMRSMFQRPSDLGDAKLTGRWVSLPGGDFEMGSPEDEAGRADDETQHLVHLAPFWLAEAEVTAKQFRRLVPEHRPDDAADLPAIAVSRYAATAYAAWVGARLPTEAEWEYGSRWQGEGKPLATTAYCAGDTEADLDRVGWYRGNSGNRPHPVKQKADCGGLYDMHGTAWEWVAGWSGEYSTDDGAAVGGPAGPPTGENGVVRGGAYGVDAVAVRSARRDWGWPRIRNDWIGFRLARSSTPSQGLDP